MFPTVLLLDLHSGSAYQVPSKLPNGSGGQGSDGQPDVVVIPTIDGETPLANHDGAKVHVSELAVRLVFTFTTPADQVHLFSALSYSVLLLISDFYVHDKT